MVQLDSTQDPPRIVIAGALRLPDAAGVLDAARDAAGLGCDVALDLSEAEHLHAAVLQVLWALRAQLTKTGFSLSVQRCSTAARNALRFAGMTDLVRDPKELD